MALPNRWRQEERDAKDIAGFAAKSETLNKKRQEEQDAKDKRQDGGPVTRSSNYNGFQ